MANLVFPELATIRLKRLVWQGDHKPSKEQEYPVPNIAFGVNTFARHKNDYHLAPFFSDENGVVTITKELLEIDAEAELETGLMDYIGISGCYPLVEIRLWSEDDLERAISGRRVWGLLRREATIWESADELIKRLREARNRDLIIEKGLGRDRLRDEWDGSQQEYSYDFFVRPKKEAAL